MAPRPRRKSDIEILDVARECFLEYGPGVSAQLIADRVGLSQPTLFKRFKTKKELMQAALLPPERSSLIDWLDSNPKPGDVYPQLKELTRRLWATSKDVVPRMAVLHMSGNLSGVFHSHDKRIPYFTVVEAIAGWLHRAQTLGSVRPEINPVLWAQGIMETLLGRALLHFVVHPYMEEADSDSYSDIEDDKQYVHSLVELLFKGIAVPPES
jgi:AcrR family transcriptional regulator